MAKKEMFKDLVSIGKKQGYLTYDQINEKLSEKDVSADKLDNFYIRLAELGIKIVDKSSTVSVQSRQSSKKEKNAPETADIVVKSNEDEEINPVRMYLTEMAKVPLLERNVEVELAKNVKENEKKTYTYSVRITINNKRNKKLGYFDRAGRNDAERAYAQRKKINNPT